MVGTKVKAFPYLVMVGTGGNVFRKVVVDVDTQYDVLRHILPSSRVQVNCHQDHHVTFLAVWGPVRSWYHLQSATVISFLPRDRVQ